MLSLRPRDSNGNDRLACTPRRGAICSGPTIPQRSDCGAGRHGSLHSARPGSEAQPGPARERSTEEEPARDATGLAEPPAPFADRIGAAIGPRTHDTAARVLRCTIAHPSGGRASGSPAISKIGVDAAPPSAHRGHGMCPARPAAATPSAPLPVRSIISTVLIHDSRKRSTTQRGREETAWQVTIRPTWVWKPRGRSA